MRGGSRSKPKFQVGNNVEALFRGPQGGVLDVSDYDHGLKHKLKCYNERALQAISIAGYYYADTLMSRTLPSYTIFGGGIVERIAV